MLLVGGTTAQPVWRSLQIANEPLLFLLASIKYLKGSSYMLQSFSQSAFFPKRYLLLCPILISYRDA